MFSFTELVLVLPVAVGGRADTVREIHTTLSRQRLSIVDVVRRERDSSDSIFDATANALTVHRGLGLTVERSDAVAAVRWDVTALNHVGETRVKISNHCVARHGCFTTVESNN